MELDRGHDIGSDHFPLYSKLIFEPQNSEEQKPEPATVEEIENAKEQIRKAEKNK